MFENVECVLHFFTYNWAVFWSRSRAYGLWPWS